MCEICGRVGHRKEHCTRRNNHNNEEINNRIEVITNLVEIDVLSEDIGF